MAKEVTPVVSSLLTLLISKEVVLGFNGYYHFDSDMAQQNDVNFSLKNQAVMIFLPQTTEKELQDILALAKHGVAVSRSAAKTIGPLIGSIDISESNDGFLFHVALPGVKKDETFKCDIQSDGTITIQGVPHTGEKKLHAHGMVFEMHTQNLGPPGVFSDSFQLDGDVDPSTLEHALANGVLEGVVKKKPIQSS